MRATGSAVRSPARWRACAAASSWSRGNAGERAGDRMRRGTIIVEGGAGAYAGSRMIAGTLIVRRKAGALPGYLMRRGTIVLGDGAEQLSPTFVDCGVHELVALRLMAAFVDSLQPTRWRRLSDARCGGSPATWRYWGRARYCALTD